MVPVVSAIAYSEVIQIARSRPMDFAPGNQGTRCKPPGDLDREAIVRVVREVGCFERRVVRSRLAGRARETQHRIRLGLEARIRNRFITPRADAIGAIGNALEGLRDARPFCRRLAAQLLADVAGLHGVEPGQSADRPVGFDGGRLIGRALEPLAEFDVACLQAALEAVRLRPTRTSW